MNNVIKNTKKVIFSKYFLFFFATFLMLIYIWNKDIVNISMDAVETVKVAKTLFTHNIYGSYVMYKGIYAFLPCALSYWFGKITSLSIYLLLKIMKSIVFAYVTTVGAPYLIKRLFSYEPKIWQIYIYTFLIFLLEKNSLTLLSVDLMSFALFVLLINQVLKINEKESKIKLFIIGLLIGLNSCLSGQFSISTYIILIFLIYELIKKYKKSISKLALIFMIITIGFTLTKSINIYYEKAVVDVARANGDWIPTGEEWIIHGLSGNITTLNYPASVPDNLSQSVVKNLDASKYDQLINGQDVFNYESYIKMILKYPVEFMVRWTERLYLGLVNDPLNSFPTIPKIPVLIVSFMAACLYVFWKYIKNNLKSIKDLLKPQSFIFLAFLFSALVPTFGHVENRYYLACRSMLIASLCLTSLLNTEFEKIKKPKKEKININMNIVECIIFIIICIVIYYALYQSIGVTNIIF